MKFLFSILFIFCFYLNSFSQINFNKPPWEIGCDTLSTQLEMNVCSLEKLKIADSILNNYYDIIINYIESEYQNELKLLEDTTNIFQKENLLQLKYQKEALINSRIDFNNFVNSTTPIISYQYQKGSMQPMAENNFALKLTINQIKILTELKREIVFE